MERHFADEVGSKPRHQIGRFCSSSLFASIHAAALIYPNKRRP